MSGKTYKVGDRVRRIFKDGDVPIGTLGTVARLGEYVYVDFDNGRKNHACLAERLELHSPAPAFAPSQSAFAQHAAAEFERANAQYMQQQMMAQGSYRNGLGQQQAQHVAAPGPCINHVTHERARELCEAAVQKATVGLRSELADYKAENDHQARELQDARLRIAWLERENVRLSGKAKGAR